TPGKKALLTEQVGALRESRSRVLDAADAERRRIERDLHDGTQQHLVSVAMTLGLAQAKLDQGNSGAEIRELIDQAHRESKDAIIELRNVIRGVYPAVLTDRGLDAALSALAARSAVPVTLQVNLARRPSPTIEAISYFVVSECLTNIARHARATTASITLSQSEKQLHVVVSDDGCGGAQIGDGPGGGTGLSGLRHRVQAVSGTLDVESTPTSGTLIRVVLPCA
ncbi:MAG: sensor histidine kinase, partial [Angustibacter sp.]